MLSFPTKVFRHSNAQPSNSASDHSGRHSSVSEPTSYVISPGSEQDVFVRQGTEASEALDIFEAGQSSPSDHFSLEDLMTDAMDRDSQPLPMGDAGETGLGDDFNFLSGSGFWDVGNTQKPARHASPEPIDSPLNGFNPVLAEDAPEVDADFEQFKAYHHMTAARKGAQKALEHLNQIEISNKFPFEKDLGRPGHFTNQKLGDYISRQPRFKNLLEHHPQELKEALEALGKLPQKIDEMPGSQQLRDQNAYIYQHFKNHMLNYALEKLLDNPARLPGVENQLRQGMQVASYNASLDPALKTEERILREIEAHQEKLGVMEKTLALFHVHHRNDTQAMASLASEPNAHLLVKKVKDDLYHLAALEEPEEKKKAKDALDLRERVLSAKLAEERLRQKVMDPLYVSQADFLRQKMCRIFPLYHTSHPLKHEPGYRDLWLSQGGDPAQVFDPLSVNVYPNF